MKTETFGRFLPAYHRDMGRPVHNRVWDAFGHCWIGCAGTEKCGSVATAIAGKSREFYREYLDDRPHDSYEQDTHNQTTGRGFGSAGLDCFTACDAAVRASKLDLTAPEGTCYDGGPEYPAPCEPGGPGPGSPAPGAHSPGDAGWTIQRASDSAASMVGPGPEPMGTYHPTEAPAPVPSAPATPKMPPKITFWINAFIPNTLPEAHIQPTGQYSGRQVFEGPPLPYHRGSCFETDERGFDSSFPHPPSRLSYTLGFDTGAKVAIVADPRSSLTFEVDCSTGMVKCVKPPKPKASAHLIAPILPGSQRHDLIFEATASDPCVLLAPDIALRGNLAIDLASRTVDCQILTTIFPAIEMYADMGYGTVTIFTQPAHGGVSSLLVPGINRHTRQLSF